MDLLRRLLTVLVPAHIPAMEHILVNPAHDTRLAGTQAAQQMTQKLCSGGSVSQQPPSSRGPQPSHRTSLPSTLCPPGLLTHSLAHSLTRPVCQSHFPEPPSPPTSRPPGAQHKPPARRRPIPPVAQQVGRGPAWRFQGILRSDVVVAVRLSTRGSRVSVRLPPWRAHRSAWSASGSASRRTRACCPLLVALLG